MKPRLAGAMLTLLSGRTVTRVADTWTFWITVWTAMVFVRCLGLASRYINHDAAWYLYMGRVILDGGRLYRDVVDTNPPLIVWLTMPPVYAAQLLEVPEPLMFVLYVSVVAAISLVACARLIARVWPDFPLHIRLALVTLVLFFVFVRIHTEFGQREHLTVLLSLPYVLAAMAWTEGRPLGRRAGFAAGMGAGLGLALKPHLLAPALLVEGYLVLIALDRRPWRRSEALALGVTVLCYGLALVLLVPECFEVGWRVARVYGGLNPPLVSLLRVPEVPLWGLVALVLWLIRIPSRGRHAWVVLFLAGTGFLIAGLGQMKGWAYHLYPARVTLTLLVCAAVLWLLHAAGDLAVLIRGGSRSMTALLAVALVVGTARQTFDDRQPDPHDLVTPPRATVERYARHEPIYVMGMLLYPAFPLVNVAQVAWSSRYNSSWFLPGLYLDELAARGEFRFRTATGMPALERAFYGEVIGDLCERPPSVLIVESVTHYGGGGRRQLDLLTYYGQDLRFTRLFAAYALVDRVGAFSVYVARTPPTCALQDPQPGAIR